MHATLTTAGSQRTHRVIDSSALHFIAAKRPRLKPAFRCAQPNSCGRFLHSTRSHNVRKSRGYRIGKRLIMSTAKAMQQSGPKTPTRFTNEAANWLRLKRLRKNTPKHWHTHPSMHGVDSERKTKAHEYKSYRARVFDALVFHRFECEVCSVR